MVKTRREIAAGATQASAEAARKRRVSRYVGEIAEHPEALDTATEVALAEVLRGKGWSVNLAA